MAHLLVQDVIIVRCRDGLSLRDLHCLLKSSHLWVNTSQ
jgi:hypothetical protein